MIIQWHFLLAVWSLKFIKISLAENLLRDPHEVWEPIQSSYYVEADTDPSNIKPSEERKRFQRSFLKKWWKNSGLQDLFGDDGCVNCCKNGDYQAGDGDTYQTPPTYSNYLPLSPPLTPFPHFDPLRIFQPFFRPMDSYSNGPYGNGYVNNYESGTNSNDYGAVNPSNYESANNYNSPGSVDGSSNMNSNDGKADVTYDKPNVAYGEDAYVKPESSPKKNPTTIVYQPIIYVSPQYQQTPLINSSGGDTAYPESPYNSPSPPSGSVPSQPCRWYGGSNINPPKVPDPIILTAADQPYRNCPELFTEYCNKINNLY